MRKVRCQPILANLMLATLPFFAQASGACEEDGLRLEGAATVPVCEDGKQECVSGARAVYEYAEAFPDTDADIVIAVPSSPWHFYDGDGRIMSAAEMAGAIKEHINDKTKRVILVGSWTGGASDASGRSLAQEVSRQLDGFPVEGMDGFLWLSADGSHRVSRQAWTLRQGAGYYQIAKGSEVLVPLSHGWASGLEDRFVADGAKDLLLTAAIGWEVFYLCRGRALAGFELAAKHGDGIAAYNAAILYLERDARGDRENAKLFLEQAAQRGDTKAAERLKALGE